MLTYKLKYDALDTLSSLHLLLLQGQGREREHLLLPERAVELLRRAQVEVAVLTVVHWARRSLARYGLKSHPPPIHHIRVPAVWEIFLKPDVLDFSYC